MTDDEAQWVRDHVLYSTPPALCACQAGMCAPCELGEHDRCDTRVCDGGQPLIESETWVAGHDRWTDAHPVHRAIYDDVWLADRVCQWICPCPTCGYVTAAVDAVPPVPEGVLF